MCVCAGTGRDASQHRKDPAPSSFFTLTCFFCSHVTPTPALAGIDKTSVVLKMLHKNLSHGLDTVTDHFPTACVFFHYQQKNALVKGLHPIVKVDLPQPKLLAGVELGAADVTPMWPSF